MRLDSDEQHRHRSEVRQWLAWRVQRGAAGKEWLRKVLQDIERRRGPAAAQRLKDDILDQWRKGSKGEPGTWL